MPLRKNLHMLQFLDEFSLRTWRKTETFMRIIAGKLGGRNFASSTGFKTHPMSEKARGALFNTLGDITDLVVADVFSGTGAIGFEAISRGAKSSTLIDSDRFAQKTIKENIVTLGLEEQATLIPAHAKSWLNRNKILYDIVICDPPYNDISERLIESIAKKAVKKGGILVLSLPPKTRIILEDEFTEAQKKAYGVATLTFYRRND